MINPPVKNVSKSPIESLLVQIVADMKAERKTAEIWPKEVNFETITLIKFAECKNDYKLIILIQSRISHFSERMLIRNTWGNVPKSEESTWGGYFLVAQSQHEGDSQFLNREFEQFKDMVIGDTPENFYTLSLKLQMGFAWSLNYCKFKYILKSDDDVFVNIRRVFQFLEESDTPKTNLYTGRVNYNAKVLRTGRYRVTKAEYEKEVYPRYCSGCLLYTSDAADE